MKKIIWVKFGWSDYYRGGPVAGDFGYLKDGAGEGHEAFNFMPGPDGRYYCHIPPHGPSSVYPTNEDATGWTVICLAKFPPQKGIHVVGWYENATLIGKQVPRPEYELGIGFRRDTNGDKFTYLIRAEKAFFVPPEHRVAPFSHSSVKQAKFSYLAGPGIKSTDRKAEVLEILKAELVRLKSLAIAQPNPTSAPDDLENSIDPMAGFGTPEHRREVELAAEKAVTIQLKAMGYTVKRRSDEKIGYDLQATPRARGQELYVEVKGTSGIERRFFMTPNEHECSSIEGWRLAIVTDALASPTVSFFTRKQVDQRFSMQPMVWIGREVEGTE